MVESKDRVLAYIPSLQKLFEVPIERTGNIAGYVESDIEIEALTSFDDYQFSSVRLIVTDKCNLTCPYCYEHGSPKRKGVVMPDLIAKTAIDMVVECCATKGIDTAYISFFGGEPTTAHGLLVSLVCYINEETEKAGINSRMSIITNGVMPEADAIWLSENLNGITMSMDGYATIHNKQRDQSFDHAFATAKLLHKKTPNKLSFRATITQDSVEMLPSIVEFFGEEFPGSNLMLEPMFEIGRAKSSVVRMPDHTRFFDCFLKSLPVARATENKLRTSVLNLGSKRRQFCGVPGNNFMVTPDGRVTACNRMMSGNEVAEPRFVYGRYDEIKKGFVFDDEKYQQLKELTLDSIAACKDCFAQTNCRGECPANKAVIDPENFWKNPSYRCREIQEFIKKLLFYIIDNGDNELNWRD